LAEFELLQRLHPRQPRIPEAAFNRPSFPFFQLTAQQRFQITEVSLSFPDCLFRQTHTLGRHRRQAQLLALLLNRGLLQSGAHSVTSPLSSWS
jgi:hypothetical protein